MIYLRVRMNELLKGRGANINTPNRFEPLHVDVESEDYLDEPYFQISPKTVFYKDHSRTILTENDSPDVGFDVSINPYRGCEHGCIYCYARPTHEYLGFSAGVEFESKIFVKENAPELLRKKLLSKSWRPQCINLSGITDCYQPVERKLTLTRRCLEVLAEFKNPFSIITKNQLVTRDLDLLSEMSSINACTVFITVTTLDANLCGILEPRTSRPNFRLSAIERLSAAGVPTGVLIAPVIPGLTDHELPAILSAAANAGASFAGFVPLRLPLSVLPLFTAWLENHFPDRKEKVLHRIREMRGGKLNDPNFGSRMRGEGIFADQLRALFHLFCKKHRLNTKPSDLDASHFKRPEKQMGLFG